MVKINLASSHAGMYAQPFNWVNSRMRTSGPGTDNTTTQREPTKCEDFFNKCIIPITSPIAILVGLIMFAIGVILLVVCLPFLLLTCCCCMCCADTGAGVVTFLLVIGVLILGGFVVVIYAILLLVFWPFLVIIYGARACCCNDDF